MIFFFFFFFLLLSPAAIFHVEMTPREFLKSDSQGERAIVENFEVRRPYKTAHEYFAVSNEQEQDSLLSVNCFDENTYTHKPQTRALTHKHIHHTCRYTHTHYRHVYSLMHTHTKTYTRKA